jgi:hypothetical protein
MHNSEGRTKEDVEGSSCEHFSHYEKAYFPGEVEKAQEYPRQEMKYFRLEMLKDQISMKPSRCRSIRTAFNVSALLELGH